MKLIFGWRLRHRLGFLSDTCFSSSGRLYYLYLRWIYSFLCSIDYVSLNIDIHVSRLDQTASSDERWYWQLWTILFYLSLLPGAAPYRLPSRSSNLDYPKRITVLLDNFWHIKNRQSSDFFVPMLCGFPSRHYKVNFYVLPVTDSCLLPEPLIRTHSDSFTPKTFVYTFYNTGSSTKEMASPCVIRSSPNTNPVALSRTANHLKCILN